MKKILLLIIYLNATFIFSQNDCTDAIIVCGNSNFTDLNATGIGVQELNNSNTCDSQENNSLWFKININTGGTLGFTLTPTNANGTTNNDISVDFDFFIFGPNASCGNIGQAIRCSTTNPEAAGQGNNLTGLKSSETETSEGPGQNGNSFVSLLNVNPNDSYFIVIDRPVGSSNFKINWTGTATFTDPPTLNTPTAGTSYDLKSCDNDNIDDNSTIFDLTVNESSIINGQSDITVTYHRSNNDALINEDPISDPTAFANSLNPQNIFIRLTNNNSECFAVADFSIEVTNGIALQTPTPYVLCDDVESDSSTDNLSVFTLSTKDSEILGGLSAMQYDVSYHLSQMDADTNTRPLDKNNWKSGNDIIYVRVENTSNPNCFDASKNFNIEVNALPVITSPVSLTLCDDNDDGIASFNLTNANASISNNNANETINYFKTFANAKDNLNPITNTTNYNNEIATNDTVYAKITNDNNCDAIAEINLIVHAMPIINSPVTLTLCDEDTDGITTFNLTDANALISSNANETITFFETQEEANANTNPINNSTAYENETALNDTIYARIVNTNNCSTTAQINLVVNSLPEITTPVTLSLCDDNNDGMATFNLNNAKVLISSNNANETFTFFETLTKATNNTDPITNETNYENQIAANDSVFVRITNVNNCSIIGQINLVVHPLPVVNANVELKQCDDDTDGFSNFNLTEANSLISANSTNETFVYFPTLADANANTNSITNDTAYTNNTVATETIAVRVTNANGCFRTTELLLSISTTQIDTGYNRSFASCDDFLDINGNNNENNDDTDGVSSFDFSSVKTEVEAFFSESGQTVTATFYKNEADALAEQNVISDISNYRNIGFPNTQQIYVRVDSNIDNGCLGLGPYITLTVNPLPVFSVTSPQILCLNHPQLTLSAENPEESYTYQWKDTDGNNLGTEETQEINSGGNYSVTVTKKDGTNCSRIKNIIVNESDAISLTEEDLIITDDSNNNSIRISSDRLSSGDYEFALFNEIGTLIKPYQDEPLFDQLEGGIYTLSIRDKNDCGTTTLNVSIIEFPNFFTPNGDGIKDSWFVKGVNATLFKSSTIRIFNRQGKVLAEIPLGYGWNGFFNGRQAPANEYWFTVQLEGINGNIRNKSGNFSLLR